MSRAVSGSSRHEREHRFGLMNREHRPVGDDDELLVRHDRGDFDDGIGFRLQARHLEVDPDQIVAARHGMGATAIRKVAVEFSRGYPEPG